MSASEGGDDTPRTSVMDLVAQARARVEALSPAEVRAELEAGDAAVLDIRDVRERWRDGAVPGARHVPRGMLEFWADPDSPYHKEWLTPQRRTVLYCAGGARSALAARALEEIGYTDVAHLESGFGAWRDAGESVEQVSGPDRQEA